MVHDVMVCRVSIGKVCSGTVSDVSVSDVVNNCVYSCLLMYYSSLL